MKGLAVALLCLLTAWQADAARIKGGWPTRTINPVTFMMVSGYSMNPLDPTGYLAPAFTTMAADNVNGIILENLGWDEEGFYDFPNSLPQPDGSVAFPGTYDEVLYNGTVMSQALAAGVNLWLQVEFPYNFINTAVPSPTYDTSYSVPGSPKYPGTAYPIGDYQSLTAEQILGPDAYSTSCAPAFNPAIQAAVVARFNRAISGYASHYPSGTVILFEEETPYHDAFGSGYFWLGSNFPVSAPCTPNLGTADSPVTAPNTALNDTIFAYRWAKVWELVRSQPSFSGLTVAIHPGPQPVKNCFVPVSPASWTFLNSGCPSGQVTMYQAFINQLQADGSTLPVGARRQSVIVEENDAPERRTRG